MSEPLTSKDLVVGGFYNWKVQPERLSYIGAQRYNGDSRTWHQFALVDVPGVCWCEVLDWQLNLFEVTERAAVQAAQPEAVGDMVMVPAEIVNRFPEINPSNYDHDDACALNAWGLELVLAATPSAPTAVEPDEQRYQLLRRGQHWSVIDGVGDVLRGDDLDAAVDSILAARASKGTPL